MDYIKASQTLRDYVHFSSHPLAINLIGIDSDFPIPEKVQRPGRDGKKMTLCQAYKLSAANGWRYFITLEDTDCPLYAMAFGLASQQQTSEFLDSGELAAALYTNDLNAGANLEMHTPRLELGKYKGVLIQPLEKATESPDVVLVFGDQSQILRMIHAANFYEGKGVKSESTGRLGCASSIIVPFNTKEATYSIPCSGEYAYANLTDLKFSFPGSDIEKMLKGLEKTHKDLGHPLFVSPHGENKFNDVYTAAMAAIEKAAAEQAE